MFDGIREPVLRLWRATGAGAGVIRVENHLERLAVRIDRRRALAYGVFTRIFRVQEPRLRQVLPNENVLVACSLYAAIPVAVATVAAVAERSGMIPAAAE
jgi:hypothetical protein